MLALLQRKLSQLANCKAILHFKESLRAAGFEVSNEKRRMMSLYRTGNIDEAEIAAKSILKQVRDIPPFWNTGNIIHAGNTIVGIAELSRGNIEAAKKCLIISSKAPPSPQLATKGPCLDLAYKLAEIGEYGVVKEFIRNISRIWRHDRGAAAHWIPLLDKKINPWKHEK